MEFTTSYCPNPQCTHYGQRGFGAHLVYRGVGPTAVFLGYCVPGVRVYFRLVRVQRTSESVQRSRITPSGCVAISL